MSDHQAAVYGQGPGGQPIQPTSVVLQPPDHPISPVASLSVRKPPHSQIRNMAVRRVENNRVEPRSALGHIFNSRTAAVPKPTRQIFLDTAFPIFGLKNATFFISKTRPTHGGFRD